jgi:hypothetical protein
MARNEDGTPTFRNPFGDTTLGAHLGCSQAGPVAASAIAVTAPDECEIEMCQCQWSANVTEARGRNRHMTDCWKGDASAKAVLMFVSSFI